MLYVDAPENRFIWMDFPTPERVATLSDELHRRHADCFMVWNLSGACYDEVAFGGRVVSLRFSGHLCPPLLMLVEACLSIQAWLSADAANVVRRAHSEGKPFFCECAAALACLCRAFHVAEEPRCCRLLRQPPHPRAAIRGVSV